jgi:hypothetical protein
MDCASSDQLLLDALLQPSSCCWVAAKLELLLLIIVITYLFSVLIDLILQAFNSTYVLLLLCCLSAGKSSLILAGSLHLGLQVQQPGLQLLDLIGALLQGCLNSCQLLLCST